MTPKIKRVLGSGIFWQTIIEDKDGKIWEGWFNTYTKETEWRLAKK